MATASQAKRTVLITGASSGIGLELAKLFAKDQHDLVLVARSEGKLRQLAQELQQQPGVAVHVLAEDLSRAEAADRVCERVKALGLTIDVLVNNAGFGHYGAFAESDFSKELEMIQVNMVTLTALTKRLLPGMVERKFGRILNVASTAAFQPGPLMAVYYATKAYVLSFSEALAAELAGSGVSVTALCPGPTQSGFQEQAAMLDSKLVRGKSLPDAKSVAEAGYRALLAGKRVYIPGFSNWSAAQAVRFLPRRAVTSLVIRAQARAD